MAWFKVDDKFHSHPKVLGLPLRAIGLWTKAGAWCADQLTDGYIPKTAVTVLGGTAGDARLLVEAGLWKVDGDGWRFHDWLELQPSRKDTLEKREQDRARKAEARAAKAGKTKAENERKLRSVQ